MFDVLFCEVAIGLLKTLFASTTEEIEPVGSLKLLSWIDLYCEAVSRVLLGLSSSFISLIRGLSVFHDELPFLRLAASVRIFGVRNGLRVKSMFTGLEIWSLGVNASSSNCFILNELNLVGLIERLLPAESVVGVITIS